MKRAVLIAFLALAACESNSPQIIDDVCKPLNNDENVSLENLATEKGYDVARARAVCQQYVRDEVAKTEENLRKLGVR